MRPFLCNLMMLSICCGTCGCALFSPGTERLLSRPFTDGLNENEVAEFENPAAPVKRVVRLQTAIVSAPENDRRLRSLVWEQLDESGLMAPEDRRRLNESGLRIGVAGASLPWALESLLKGERNASPSGRKSEINNFSGGSPIAIAEGSRSIIDLPRAGKSIVIPAKRIAGLYEGRELPNARCVIEVSATEYGEEWVVLKFQPQLHHGSFSQRYTVTDSGEQLPVRQRIQPFYDQQFELKLHRDETVVIGYQPMEDWSIGRMMFQSEELSGRSERLIALRLSGVDSIVGQKSVVLEYSKN